MNERRKRVLGVVVRYRRVELPEMPDLGVVWIARVKTRRGIFKATRKTRPLAIRAALVSAVDTSRL